ncbi:hypothetical protein, unlikely [Trypanosoma brucei gambiense DAL972]|uniref:Uncharacterized protein n=1 Tax=Trypanosoma brucei gambiense (strain MHOM/CI/86/DAL972) TaxID=679716 RepID=D0A0B8_TRYB9|nr:hypothetical protein, unlikely [Trypanosoma brucei gambiense DAL972]CBH16676.1 hypothetical protein, unlikely [Trypanosoma brucei gambiense DAL972]|eukprot:XP_011778940.1 hypothetical protein, unlikely [Trypanosoma brucei gambiense DAL972]
MGLEYVALHPTAGFASASSAKLLYYQLMKTLTISVLQHCSYDMLLFSDGRLYCTGVVGGIYEKKEKIKRIGCRPQQKKKKQKPSKNYEHVQKCSKSFGNRSM